MGRVKPLRLNPVPLTFAAEIVTLVRPVLVSVSVTLLLLPSCTLLKLTVEGLALKAARNQENCERVCAAAMLLQKSNPAESNDKTNNFIEKRGRVLIDLVSRKLLLARRCQRGSKYSLVCILL